MIEFISKYIDFSLFFLILFGGIFVVKFTKKITVKNRYKILFISLLFGIIIWYFNGKNNTKIPKFCITYFATTSFYEIIAKQVKNFIANKLSDFIVYLFKDSNNKFDDEEEEIHPDDYYNRFKAKKTAT